MGKKMPFHLKPKDRQNIKYQAFCLISEIKKELNRIVVNRNVKPVTSKEIYDLLITKGYIKEQRINGRLVWIQTQTGLDKGIALVDKTSSNVPNYEVLIYPTEVQQEIVEYYIGIGESQFPDEMNESDGLSVYSIEKNSDVKNRTQKGCMRKGARWSEEEEKQIVSEYESGIKITEIGKNHQRTVKAIRSRLLKNGVKNL